MSFHMSGEVLHEFAALIPRLAGLDYVSAKKLLAEVANYRLRTSTGCFWSIAQMTLDRSVPAGVTRSSQIRSWFSSLSCTFVPPSTDPLVGALITNDFAVLQHDAAGVSPYLPLLMHTSGNVPSPFPDFLNLRTYRLAGSAIEPETFWRLCFADVSALIPLNLNWLVSFAIYFWKFHDQSDLCAAFDAFCQIPNHPADDGDPIYVLLLHMIHGGPSAFDVAGLLPAIDGHFFLSILN
jgi:hypothetical protein